MQQKNKYAQITSLYIIEDFYVFGKTFCEYFRKKILIIIEIYSVI